METCNPLPQKEIIIDKLKGLGYEENTKIIDGGKKITEYTKSFLSYSFVNQNGEGEYPLLLVMNFKDPDSSIYGIYKNAIDLMASGFAEKLSNVRHKKEKPYYIDSDSMIIDTNIDGVRYLEEALEGLEIPGFNIKLDEMKNSSYGTLLQELGYEVEKDELNHFLAGHSENIDVVYAPITKITDDNKEKVPFPWKAKTPSNKIRENDETYRKFKSVCNKNGSPENRYKQIEVDEGIVTRRFNLQGLIEVTGLLQPQPDSDQITPQSPK